MNPICGRLGSTDGVRGLTPSYALVQRYYPGDGYRGLKDHHPWEQGVSEAMYVIENLSYENDLVVGPFLGSGTVAVAAKRLNRRFVGCDVDEHCANETKRRLSDQ